MKGGVAAWQDVFSVGNGPPGTNRRWGGGKEEAEGMVGEPSISPNSGVTKSSA
jgi:hypothetical protein